MKSSTLFFLLLGISTIFFSCTETDPLLQDPDPNDQDSSLIQIQSGSFEFEGVKRDYSVFLPANFTDTIAFPLVVYLHSYGWTPSIEMKYTKLNDAADTSGFIIAYPKGIPDWNSGVSDDSRWPTDSVNDVGFIDVLIDTLSAHYSIDLSKVYACGYSNGGFMAYKLAFQLGNRFAAIASVSGVMSISTEADSNPLRSMPVLHIHGTDDYFVPYIGSQYWKSVDQCINYWTIHNECDIFETTILPDLDPNDGCTVEKTIFSSSTNDVKVILFKVIDGGHTWPGAGIPDYENAGKANNDFSGNAEILDFFNNYKLE